MNKQEGKKEKRKIFDFLSIEILVAIAVASFIFLISSLIFISLYFNQQNKQEAKFDLAKNDILNEVSNTVRWAKSITVLASHNSFISEMPNGDKFTFSLISGRILKNDNPITPASITIKSFEVQNLSRNPKYASLVILTELASKDNETLADSMRLVVSQRYLKK